MTADKDVIADPSLAQIVELVERWADRQSFDEIAAALEVDRPTISRWTRTKAVKLATLGMLGVLAQLEAQLRPPAQISG